MLAICVSYIHSSIWFWILELIILITTIIIINYNVNHPCCAKGIFCYYAAIFVIFVIIFIIIVTIVIIIITVTIEMLVTIFSTSKAIYDHPD